MSNQKRPSGYSFLKGSSKPDKGKGKDTGNQSSSRRISPTSDRGDNNDGSSSSSKEKSDQKKL